MLTVGTTWSSYRKTHQLKCSEKKTCPSSLLSWSCERPGTAPASSRVMKDLKILVQMSQLCMPFLLICMIIISNNDFMHVLFTNTDQLGYNQAGGEWLYCCTICIYVYICPSFLLFKKSILEELQFPGSQKCLLIYGAVKKIIFSTLYILCTSADI